MRRLLQARSVLQALLTVALASLLFCTRDSLIAQQTGQASTTGSSSRGQSGEMSVKEETSTSSTDSGGAKFRVNVKLVLARVVVRDSTGHAVGNLKKEDFQIFDNGKPQVISDFDVEHIGPQASTSTTTASLSAPNTAEPAVNSATLPVRYIA